MPEERLIRAQRRLLREAAEFQLRIERARAVRDVATSIAQASATNPFWSQAAIALAGAGVATVGGMLSQIPPVQRANGSMFSPGSFLGQSHLEAVGEAMMALAGAKAAAGSIADVIGAIRGQQQHASIAFDVPDVETPGILEGAVVGSFRPAVAGRRGGA